MKPSDPKICPVPRTRRRQSPGARFPSAWDCQETAQHPWWCQEVLATWPNVKHILIMKPPGKGVRAAPWCTRPHFVYRRLIFSEKSTRAIDESPANTKLASGSPGQISFSVGRMKGHPRLSLNPYTSDSREHRLPGMAVGAHRVVRTWRRLPEDQLHPQQEQQQQSSRLPSSPSGNFRG